MSSNESLRLSHRLESPHPSLSYPGRLVRLFCPIILILLSTVDRCGNQLAMCNTITAQLIRHDLSWLAAMRPE